MRNTSKKQEEKRSKRIAKNAKGITLVALVITIIIIIILATVTIRFAFGDDGIIQRAEQAKDMYANDTAYTDSSMAKFIAISERKTVLIQGIPSLESSCNADSIRLPKTKRQSGHSPEFTTCIPFCENIFQKVE